MTHRNVDTLPVASVIFRKKNLGELGSSHNINWGVARVSNRGEDGGNMTSEQRDRRKSSEEVRKRPCLIIGIQFNRTGKTPAQFHTRFKAHSSSKLGRQGASESRTPK